MRWPMETTLRPSSESSLQNVLLATCPLLSEEHPHPPAQEHSHLLRPDTSAPFSTVPLPHTHGRLLLHRVLPTGPSRVLHVCHFSTSALSPPRSQPWSPLAQPAATAPSLACRLLHSSRPFFTQRQSGTFQMKTGPGLSCCHKPLPRPPTAPTTKPQRAPCRPPQSLDSAPTGTTTRRLLLFFPTALTPSFHFLRSSGLFPTSRPLPLQFLLHGTPPHGQLLLLLRVQMTLSSSPS